jgi:hypothetical protein
VTIEVGNMNDVRSRLDRPDTAPAERQGLQRLRDELTTRFPTVPPEVIAEEIARASGQFGDAAVREYVLVLVARAVRSRLTAGTVE